MQREIRHAELEKAVDRYLRQLDKQLGQIASQSQVDSELAKLKAELGPGDEAPKEIQQGAPEAEEQKQ